MYSTPTVLYTPRCVCGLSFVTADPARRRCGRCLKHERDAAGAADAAGEQTA